MPQRQGESLGQRVRRERIRLNWSQERLAEAVGTTAMSINRWEHDKTSPQPQYREQLCRVFNLPTDLLFGTPDVAESQTPLPTPLWNIPFRRNPFFTGREEVLLCLYETFFLHEASQPQALCGLAGIGKTQTALEYAYRYRKHYQAIFWLRAETRDVLLADMLSIAETLQLIEQEERQEQHFMKRVKQWLQTASGWLMVLDNVEDFAVLNEIPPSESQGHVLLTTRTQATGMFAQRHDLKQLSLKESTLFLLRRSKQSDGIAPHDKRTQEASLME